MSVKLSWRHFQLVLLIGYRYVFRLSDCLVFNAINGQTFSPNASAEFECIIDPYTFSQAWYVDSISVADCGFSTCSENASNPKRYSFTPNTSAGNFIFKIDPISLEDNDNVIRCYDGTNFTEETSIFVTETVTTATTSKTVNDNGGGGGGGGGGEGIPYWVWIILVFVAVIIIVIVCCCCKGTNIIYCSNSCDRKQQSADMKTILREWIGKPEYCCIIMQELLGIKELLWTIVKETGILLKESDKKGELCNEIHEEDKQRIELKEQTQHNYTVGQRDQEKKLMQKRQEWITEPSWMEVKNLEENGTGAMSKMQELVKNKTFSSFVMKEFAHKEEVFNVIISKLQKNTDKYKEIQEGIEKARQDHAKK